MTNEVAGFLCDPVLIQLGIRHGFGQRGSQAPEDTFFSVQVHGVDVALARRPSEPDRARADVVYTRTPDLSVGIVTADCVPILVAADEGRLVAAIHAGWRGLAAGVIEAGLEALKAAGTPRNWVAAVGPAARGCCYEVDEPVRRALSKRYAAHLDEVLVPGRANRFQLDLPRLASLVLSEKGLESDRIGVAHRVCTICAPARFESYRRDGATAGRLTHFITARPGGAPARVDSPRGYP